MWIFTLEVKSLEKDVSRPKPSMQTEATQAKCVEQQEAPGPAPWTSGSAARQQ